VVCDRFDVTPHLPSIKPVSFLAPLASLSTKARDPILPREKREKSSPILFS